uniref:Atlastin-3 n=1 Tax=Lygus hesperus TaxID=30085 RepID=A0A0A9XG65_LYGHE
MELVKRCRRGHRYKLNNEAIKSLLNAEVRDLKVAVISVFGKGSGIIFELLLKYANHRFKEERSANDDWLAEAIDPRKDTVVRTKPITIWPEFFVTNTRKLGKIAILLMGSQGILSFEEEAGTFAINVLMSSCQLFIVNRRISEEQLKHLETFTEFAKRLQDVGVINKAFQHLVFLVRGWETPTQYDFGFEGGHRYLIESVIHEARLAPGRLKTR